GPDRRFLALVFDRTTESHDTVDSDDLDVRRVPRRAVLLNYALPHLLRDRPVYITPLVFGSEGVHVPIPLVRTRVVRGLGRGGVDIIGFFRVATRFFAPDRGDR